MSKGSDFEKLVADLERDLSPLPGVKVIYNVKMPDSQGGTRQIDVLIVTEGGRFEFKIIIECKNTKAKVDRKTVEAFKCTIEAVELWLVIIIDDLNSFCGFDLSTIDLPKLAHSNFDRIYLFEKFGGNIYPLV